MRISEYPVHVLNLREGNNETVRIPYTRILNWIISKDPGRTAQ